MIVTGADPKKTIAIQEAEIADLKQQLDSVLAELKATQDNHRVLKAELKLTIEQAQEDAAFCDSYR